MYQQDYYHALAIALAAGETQELAALFATCYADDAAEARKCILNGTGDPSENVEETALAYAWVYLGKYKRATAQGHGSTWAEAYARAYEESESEGYAYAAIRKQHPTDIIDRCHQGVYREAFIARQHHGLA